MKTYYQQSSMMLHSNWNIFLDRISSVFFPLTVLFRLMPILSGLLNFPLWFGHFTKVKFYICKCNLLLLVHHIFIFFGFIPWTWHIQKHDEIFWKTGCDDRKMAKITRFCNILWKQNEQYSNTHTKTIHLHRKTNSNN